MANFAPSASEPGAATVEGAPPRQRASVGDLLRRTREERGGDLETIAAMLRVRLSYLEAIEQGRYDRLPGPVYALGFVRSYGNHLGLDGEELVRRFKLEASGLEQRRDLAFPMPLTPRSVPGGRMLLAAFVLAVCAYGIWHYLATGERGQPERVAAVPADLLPPAPPAPPPVLPAAAATDTSLALAAPAPAVGAPAGDTSISAAPTPASVTATPLPAPVGSGSLVAPPPPPLPPADSAAALGATAPPSADAAAPPSAPTVPTVTVAAAPEQPGGPHVYGAISGPSRITLKAIKDCWIQVRDTDPAQTVVAQRTLRVGDTYRVPLRDGLVLRTGNATGLQVLVDDKVAPALGGTVRNLALDPARLVAGTAHIE